MAATVVSKTVQSKTVENDDEAPGLAEVVSDVGIDSVAFASMGTGPALTSQRGGRLRVTAGTGVPAVAANNVQVTCKRPPRKVFLANGQSAPGFHVASISGSVINIGTKAAPAVSTAYDLDLIVLY